MLLYRFSAMHASIVHYLFISNVKKVVSGATTERLWTTYDRTRSMEGVKLNSLIKLCLADPSFPAYVEQVEKELNKVKDEMKA